MWLIKLLLILPLVVTVCTQAQFGNDRWTNLHPKYQPRPLIMMKRLSEPLETLEPAPVALPTLILAEAQQAPSEPVHYCLDQPVQPEPQHPTLNQPFNQASIPLNTNSVPVKPVSLRQTNDNEPILPPMQTFDTNYEYVEMPPQNLPDKESIITSQPEPSYPVPNEVNNIPEYEGNYDCVNGNGYYPIPNNCDSYIKCEDQIGVRYLCPDGLHFNPATKWMDYPCAFPSEVECPPGSEEQPANPTDQCPRQYGFFSLQDGECSKYNVCQEGKATVMGCPAGLVFNNVSSICDWPINVPGCNPNVFKDFQCPDPPSDLADGLSDIIYKYKYDDQCKQFVACQSGQPRLLSCDSGLLFDEVSQACVDKEYVTGCATPYST